ncbi:hypothetical protein D3C76_163650 [compost metagenome]
MFTVEEYLAYIINEHADKPKFVDTISKTVAPLVDIKNTLDLIRGDDFDLDFAIGNQLDIIGIWVGIGRTIRTPLSGIYFSFDIVGLGFDQGVWKGPFDPDTGLTVLNDESYRFLLRAKIGANNWDGTMETSKAILDAVFRPTETGTYASIRDNQDMSMTFSVSGAIPSALNLALITGGYINLKPSTVRIDAIIVTSIDDTPLFGFDANNQYVAGFDVGSWGTIV